MTWTAIDLLEKILEFAAMTPDQNQWDEQSLADNPPRQIRLQRINALLSAFGMIEQDSQKRRLLQDHAKNAIHSIICGDFIEKGDLSDYKSVITTIEKYISPSFKDRSIDFYELKYFYDHLVQYKTAVRSVLKFNSGSEGPIGVIAAYHLSEDCNKMIKKQIKPIDHLLAQIIDPENREFEEQELIDKYGFPKDDLLDIDIDYM